MIILRILAILLSLVMLFSILNAGFTAFVIGGMLYKATIFQLILESIPYIAGAIIWIYVIWVSITKRFI